MKINRKIPDIITFNISNQKLLYAKNSNKSLYVDNKHIDDDIDTNEYFFIKDILYRKKGETFYGKEKLFDSSFLGKSVNYQDSSFILKSDTELDEEDFSIISNYSFFSLLNSEKIYLSRLKNIIHCINKSNFVFLGSDKNIYAYTLPNANLLWEFDLSELGSYFDTFSREEKEYEVAKFLGVWQDELLIACNGGLILSLSVKSGEIIRKWDTLPPNSESTLREVFRGYIHQSGNVFQFNKNQDRIFGLYLCHLVEIDLEKGDILITHLKDTLESHQISAFQNKSGYAEDDTHYYTTVFLDKKKLGVNYMPTAICSLNKTTLKIDWLYRFDTDDTDDYISIQVPQTSNNKLYQLTQNKVLYIFEKE